MHLSLSIVLAVILIAGVQSQRPDDPPRGNRPFFDRPRPFGFRGLPPPPQTRLSRLFNRPNRPFRFGRPSFLNSEANGAPQLPFSLEGLGGPPSPPGPPGPPRPRGPFRRDASSHCL